MSVHSAGILLYRTSHARLQVMLVHPGGPFWVKRDEGAWSIPKGIYQEDEDPLDAARREFQEETGQAIDGTKGAYIDLGEARQPSRKIVHIWALAHDFDTTKIISNPFSLEWPPKSGMIQQFPEVDKAQWFDMPEARKKLLKGQLVFLERLLEKLAHSQEGTDVPDAPER